MEANRASDTFTGPVCFDGTKANSRYIRMPFSYLPSSQDQLDV